MLYSIDLIAAGSLVVDHMLPVFMLFVALRGTGDTHGACRAILSSDRVRF